MRHWRLRAIAAILLLPAAAVVAADRAPAPTDANLITALDVSDSIMRHEEWLEFGGMAAAIDSEAFLTAVTGGKHGRVGFAVIVWSSMARPDVIVPWTLIETRRDARRVAGALRAARTRHGFATRMGTNESGVARSERTAVDAAGRSTDLSTAIEFSADLLRAAPFTTARAVINICGNGVDNVDSGPAAARGSALAAGMVINGLIIGAKPGVADYYRTHVQGGDGSFVLEVAEPEHVTVGMLEKFLRDLKVAQAPAACCPPRPGQSEEGRPKPPLTPGTFPQGCVSCRSGRRRPW